MNYDIGATKGRGSRNSKEAVLVITTEVSSGAQPRMITLNPQLKVRNSRPALTGLDDKLYKELSESYLYITEPMWSKLPVGSYIKYLRKDDGTHKPVAERFKSGGYVKSHSNKDGKAIIWCESHRGGNKSLPGYLNYPVVHTAVESLWKKHNAETQIEMTLIHASLAEKSRQINDLTMRLAALEATIKK